MADDESEGEGEGGRGEGGGGEERQGRIPPRHSPWTVPSIFVLMVRFLGRRCQHCQEALGDHAAAGGEGEAGDEGLLLGESWMDLTVPPTAAKGGGQDRSYHKTTHEVVEEHARVSELFIGTRRPSNPIFCLHAQHVRPLPLAQVKSIVDDDGGAAQSVAYPLCEGCTLRLMKVDSPTPLCNFVHPSGRASVICGTQPAH